MFFVFIAMGLILILSGIGTISNGSVPIGVGVLVLGVIVFIATIIYYYKNGYLGELGRKCDSCTPGDDFLCGFAFGDCLGSAGDCSLPECEAPDCDCGN